MIFVIKYILIFLQFIVWVSLNIRVNGILGRLRGWTRQVVVRFGLLFPFSVKNMKSFKKTAQFVSFRMPSSVLSSRKNKALEVKVFAFPGRVTQAACIYL